MLSYGKETLLLKHLEKTCRSEGSKVLVPTSACLGPKKLLTLPPFRFIPAQFLAKLRQPRHILESPFILTSRHLE